MDQALMLLPLAGRPESLALLLLALAISSLLRDRGPAARFLGAPADLVRRVARAADRRLNRLQRSAAARRARGMLVVLAVAAAALLLGCSLAAAATALPHGWVVELYLLLGALSPGAPWAGARACARALAEGDRPRAREALHGLTERNLQSLDDHAVARAGVEALADGLHRRLAAPCFWFVLLGLPGLLLWQAASVLDAEIGRPVARYESFGAAAARLGDLLGWPPSRLAGLAAGVAALAVGTASPAGALRTAFGDARKAPPGVAGWPVAAFAGALGLALGGPRREGEVVVTAPWIGGGRARAMAADLRRALALYAGAGLVLAAAIGGLALAA
jgi:adenosylcobinamide-phosphate synthase